MPAPKHIFDPPFNIVRASHVRLGVADLGRLRGGFGGGELAGQRRESGGQCEKRGESKRGSERSFHVE